MYNCPVKERAANVSAFPLRSTNLATVWLICLGSKIISYFLGLHLFLCIKIITFPISKVYLQELQQENNCFLQMLLLHYALANPLLLALQLSHFQVALRSLGQSNGIPNYKAYLFGPKSSCDIFLKKHQQSSV